MLKFLPAGFVGLMVGGLIAANSSTILTHLNWGASYLVHDFYRRFITPDATEKHYVLRRARRDGRCSSCCSSGDGLSARHRAKDTFDIILQIGAGTGLLYLVRWFWWRVNAWCEVVAMVVVVPGVADAARSGQERRPPLHACESPGHGGVHDRLLARHGVRGAGNRSSGARGLLPEDASKRSGLGADQHRSARRPEQRVRDARQHSARAAGWVAGCAMVWSSLFTVGNFLYGRTGMAVALLAVALGSSAVLLRIIPMFWADSPEEAATAS